MKESSFHSSVMILYVAFSTMGTNKNSRNSIVKQITSLKNLRGRSFLRPHRRVENFFGGYRFFSKILGGVYIFSLPFWGGIDFFYIYLGGTDFISFLLLLCPNFILKYFLSSVQRSKFILIIFYLDQYHQETFYTTSKL